MDMAECKSVVLEELSNEHKFFKCRMLSESRRIIYDSCMKIVFYDSVYEYFIYNEYIKQDVWDYMYNAVVFECRILDNLYELYLKHEQLSVATWSDIEEMLQVFVESGIAVNTY